MAENPLLPHRKLQELFTLMQRCRKLESKRKDATGGREAVLAGTTIHLEQGDLFSVAPSDAAAELAPKSLTERTLTDGFNPTISRWLALAAITRGLQLSGTSRIALTLARSSVTEPGWQEALAWAQSDRLPLVFCITQIPSTSRSKLAWPEVSRVCERLTLPTLTVDGEDAVAVYRVMQEAALRARTALGPSLIWAVGSPAPPVGKATPTARLRAYMAARKIPLPD